jgi:hypothetical protein
MQNNAINITTALVKLGICPNGLPNINGLQSIYTSVIIRFYFQRIHFNAKITRRLIAEHDTNHSGNVGKIKTALLILNFMMFVILY